MNIPTDIFIRSHAVPPALGASGFLMFFNMIRKLRYFHMILIFISSNSVHVFTCSRPYFCSMNCQFWFFAHFLVFLIHLYQRLVFKDNILFVYYMFYSFSFLEFSLFLCTFFTYLYHLIISVHEIWFSYLRNIFPITEILFYVFS